MRSNDAHDDPRYLMHAWGDGKGSWGQHKYIDKRWISGAWRYLYELPKNVGQSVQRTYQNAKNSFSNFRNYSTSVDKRQTQNQHGNQRAQNARAQNQQARADIAGKKAKNTSESNSLTGRRDELVGARNDYAETEQDLNGIKNDLTNKRDQSVSAEQEAEKRRSDASLSAKSAYEQTARDKEALDIASDAYMRTFERQQRYDSNEAKINKIYSDIRAGKDVDYDELSRLENEQKEIESTGNRYEDANSEDWLNTAKNRKEQSEKDLRAAKDDAYKATQERDAERAKQQQYNADIAGVDNALADLKNKQSINADDIAAVEAALAKLKDTNDKYDADMAEIDRRERELKEFIRENNLEAMKIADEQKSFKYKASRFLDNILDRADEAKDAASSTIKSGANWLKSQVVGGAEWLKGFKNYASDVNARYDRAEEEVLKREARIPVNDKLYEQATTQERRDELDTAMHKNAEGLDRAYEMMRQAEDEKTSLKYKTSRFLDNISRGNVSPYMKSGADFLKNLFGNNETVPENAVEPEGLPSRSMPQPSSGGRQYNGTSQKAVRGDAATSRDVERAWEKVQQARRDAGWKQGSNGAYGPSTPEVEAAMEEYLRLREQQSGPVGGARNSSSYSGRPRK
jgi:hypothetical protein